jgi:hypothetical protein
MKWVQWGGTTPGSKPTYLLVCTRKDYDLVCSLLKEHYDAKQGRDAQVQDGSAAFR